jgi:hypothetical protein
MATRPQYPNHFHQGYSEIPRKVPGYVNAVALAASVAESFTVPTLHNGERARHVIFGYTSNTYVNCYVAATVPGDTSDGSASELNPAGYQIPSDVTTISVISAVAGAIVTASFYA